MPVRRLIAGGLLAVALVACGTGAPPAEPGAGAGLAEPTVIPQSEPVALRIPAIGVDVKAGDDWLPLGIQGRRQGSRLVPVETKAGEIESPPVKRPKELGWYCPSGLPECGAPTPGEVGPAVILGHINGGGQKGVFSRLGEQKCEDPKRPDTCRFVLTPGSLIEVDRRDGWTATFSVTRVELPDKTAFPTQAVYGDTTAPELRLISCGGRLDKKAGRYLDQVLVYAVMTTFRPKAA